jgi:hypothetical protein
MIPQKRHHREESQVAAFSLGNIGDIGAPDGIWFFTLKILPQKMGKFVVSVGNCGYSMALASTLKNHLTKGSLLSE